MCLVTGVAHSEELPAQVAAPATVAPAAATPAAASSAVVAPSTNKSEATTNKPVTDMLIASAAKEAAPPATPYYKQPLFWTAIVVGAVLVGTVCWGIAWTTTQTPRYALVKF